MASVEAWSSALTASHRRLVTVVDSLGLEEVAGPSYDSDWSIAQVLSHLGSGAEIFSLFLRAGLRGDPAPGMAEFEPLWERWNSKTPQDQVATGLASDREFLERLGALDSHERQIWQLSMFGADQGLEDLVRLRLGEHALHTWDVGVALDPTDTLVPAAVALLVDTLDQLVARVSRPPGRGAEVDMLITTFEPARRFRLSAGTDKVELRVLDSLDVGGMPMQLPAEALIRLVYGRLDLEHTPTTVEADNPDLDTLRSIFPGF